MKTKIENYNNPDSLNDNNGVKNTTLDTDSNTIRPVFEDLSNPETFTKHISDLTTISTTSHDEILINLLDQLERLDFGALANPRNYENFRLQQKHYLVISIDEIINVARKSQWGLSKSHNSIYLFNGAYWKKLDKEKFQKLLGKAAEKFGVPPFTAKHYLFREQLFKQFLCTVYLESKLPSLDTVLINLRNGTFQIEEKGVHLRLFNRLDFLTYQLPFEYNPNAKAPIFEKYLSEVLPDKKLQDVLAEYLGSVFIRHGGGILKEEKALILYGTGANGKSVFFEVASALLGAANISHYSLQNLTNENGYFRAKITDKLVNYASEISGRQESAVFKQLVSGEPVDARLPYGEPFTIKHYAKLIFNCNELPKDVEHTNAYFRRFLIIPFDQFIPSEKQDKQLHIKIIQSELAGVFNWVLRGLKRLLNQQKFTPCEIIDKVVEQYKSESNSVKVFIDDNDYSKNPNEHERLKDLYLEYRTYCYEDGYKPVNKINFSKRIKTLGFDIVRRNIGNVVYLSKIKIPPLS